MPITTSWLVDRRIILQRYNGVVTVEELLESSLESQRLQTTTEFKVHHLVDMSHVTEHPMRLDQMRDLFKLVTNVDLGWTIIVAQTRFLRFLASMIIQIMMPRARVRFFDTFDEAFEFLSGIEPALKDAAETSSSSA